MKQLDFEKKGRHWVHPECSHLYVEFCNPPVSIGDEYQIKPIEVKKNGVSIYILSATDCVKDRLASYIHWNAVECYDQALLVSKSNPVDWDNIKEWCLKESKDGQELFDRLHRESYL